MSPGRGGRRPGSPDTRGEVLDAARRHFAADGYDGATIRAIASEAGVDPALVHHYFGTKRELFREAAAFPVDTERLLATLEEAFTTRRADLLARFFLDVWEREDTRAQLLSVLRSALSHDDAAALLRAYVGTELLGPMARRVGVERPEVRVQLAAAQMVGIALLRYVVKVEPLASLPREDVVELVTPALTRHLFEASAAGGNEPDARAPR